jgi:hypothetical protein
MSTNSKQQEEESSSKREQLDELLRTAERSVSMSLRDLTSCSTNISSSCSVSHDADISTTNISTASSADKEIPMDNWPRALEMIRDVLIPWAPKFPRAFAEIRQHPSCQAVEIREPTDNIATSTVTTNTKSDDKNNGKNDDKNNGKNDEKTNATLAKGGGELVGVIWVASADGQILKSEPGVRRLVHGPSRTQPFTTVQDLSDAIRHEAELLLVNRPAQQPLSTGSKVVNL